MVLLKVMHVNNQTKGINASRNCAQYSMGNPIPTPIENPIGNPISNPIGNPIGDPITNPIAKRENKPWLR